MSYYVTVPPIPHYRLPAVRHAIRRTAPGIGAGHAAEAFASGLGFASHAAFLASLGDEREAVHRDVDFAAVARRLVELGHDLDPAETEHSVRSLVVRELDPALAELPADRHETNTVEVGGRYRHPDGSVVHVVAGAYRLDGNVSNHWYWRKVGDDGVLEDSINSGYGNIFAQAVRDEECDAPTP